MTDFDVAIIGAGMAGASLAAELSRHLKVVLLEAEAQPGYHATGRSVAFWTESYGGPAVQPLTTASGPFLAAPPADFSDRPFMIPRGALHIGQEKDRGRAERLLADFAESGVDIAPISPAEIKRRVPNIGDDWTVGLLEPECCDIDVAALLAAYLRQARRQGALLLCNAALILAKNSGGRWSLDTAKGSFNAGLLVNAAGAWADDVAVMAGIGRIGIAAYRRTVVQIATRPALPSNLPLVIGLDGSFYFKPGGDERIWLSPHDETLSPACDAASEEWDIALAIDRFQRVVNCDTIRAEHSWAGLRSFAADRRPVIGRDPGRPEFFWLAGQGGFGIQTAPAAAKLAASLICGNIEAPGKIIPAYYAPDRFR